MGIMSCGSDCQHHGCEGVHGQLGNALADLCEELCFRATTLNHSQKSPASLTTDSGERGRCGDVWCFHFLQQSERKGD